MFVVHCVIFSKNQKLSVLSATEFCKGIYKILTSWLSVVILPILDQLDS
jgi:hypothetical protein